jgi:hypothetical protein
MLPRMRRIPTTRPTMGDDSLAMATWAFIAANAVLLTGGALMLAYGPAWYRDTVYAACGASPIALNESEERTWLVLLLLSPMILIVSMHLGARLIGVSSRSDRPAQAAPPFLYAGLALLFALEALWRARSVLLSTMESFGDFDAWILQRWTLFEMLTFPEFVIVYSLVPILAIAAMSAAFIGFRRGARFPWITASFAIGLMLVVDMALAMKKQLVLHIAMLGMAALLTGMASRRIIASFVVMVIASFGLMLQLSGSATSPLPGDSDSVYAAPMVDSAANSWREMVDSWQQPSPIVRFWIHSLTSRSALPSFYYVHAFPRYVPFTGINVPFIGTSTRTFHTTLVNEVMYPGQPGSSYSGWAFAIYAEAGLAWALAGTALLGSGIGIAWKVCGRMLTAERRLMAWLLLVSFLVLLNTDDWVNNAVSSYGILYPLLMLAVLEMVAIPKSGATPATVRQT